MKPNILQNGYFFGLFLCIPKLPLITELFPAASQTQHVSWNHCRVSWRLQPGHEGQHSKRSQLRKKSVSDRLKRQSQLQRPGTDTPAPPLLLSHPVIWLWTKEAILPSKLYQRNFKCRLDTIPPHCQKVPRQVCHQGSPHPLVKNPEIHRNSEQL